MLKIRLAAMAAMIVAATAGTSRAQQPGGITPQGPLPDGKVTVINTQIFPDQINELKQKYSQVDGQFKDRYERLKQCETQLKKMESDISTMQAGWTPEKRAQAQQEYDDLKRRCTRDYEDLKAEYDRTVDTATKPIRDKLFQFLEKYAGQKGIVMVINLAGAAQTGMLAYWHPASDITDDFVSEYNKANPVPTAPAPGPTKPPVSRPPGQQ